MSTYIPVVGVEFGEIPVYERGDSRDSSRFCREIGGKSVTNAQSCMQGSRWGLTAEAGALCAVADAWRVGELASCCLMFTPKRSSLLMRSCKPASVCAIAPRGFLDFNLARA